MYPTSLAVGLLFALLAQPGFAPAVPALAPAPQVAGAEIQQWPAPPDLALDDGRQYRAIIATSMGDVEIDLFADEAPVTVNNFVFLARHGFYDGVKFHRVISGFMIQTGDPRGNGTGGPGYSFPDEPVTRSYARGIVAMANSGPNTNGSQFFIVHGDAVSLPPNYTIFGQVADGLDVIDRIAGVPVARSASGEASQPIEDVIMRSVTIP